MSDSRAEVKIEFSIYGRKFKQLWSINWSPDFHTGYAIDDRVGQWFTDCYNEAHSEYMFDVMQDQRRLEAEAAERKERADYERLKVKYGTPEGER